MNIPAHIGAVIGYFPFIVVVPAAVAVICNRIAAAKRHPAVVYTSCGLLALSIGFLLPRLPHSVFKGRDLAVAAILAAACFVWAYLRVTNVVTKRAAALLWRELFLVGFAALSLWFVSGDARTWGYGMLAALCLATAALLWRSSPLAKYPLYAATLYLAGAALVGGIYNYLHDPALLQGSIKAQVIGWLIPAIPSALLINCCLYARRIGRGRDFSGK